MSNDLINIPPPPAYLQQLSNGFSSNLTGGISSGSFARISIKGSRFRLNEVTGEQTVVNALNLDVFVIDANPNLSKNFYAQSYNPADAEGVGKAPDCFSDNGTTPSSRAGKPQCLSCAACPHNAWGSKITPTGGKTKACADSKRYAVILAQNPTGPVYELRLPAASLSSAGNVFRQLEERGINPSTILFRLTFDSTVDYPKLVFTPAAYATQEQAAIIAKLVGSAEVRRVVGLDEGQAPVQAPAVAYVQPPQIAPPVQTFAPPVQAFTPPPAQPAPPVQAAPAAEAPKKERTRRTKEEMAAARAAEAQPAPAPVGFAEPFTPPAPFPNHAGAVAGVVINPTAANSDMDALLAQAFKL